MPQTSRRRSVISLGLAAAMLLASSHAAAIDRKTEAAGKAALAQAASYFGKGAFEEALGVLEKAVVSCGTDLCSKGTKAALLRDLGALQLRQGEKAAAEDSFALALRIGQEHRAEPALRQRRPAPRVGGRERRSAGRVEQAADG